MSKSNPYKVNDEVIPQFKFEANAWDEGYNACRKDNFDKLTEMGNAIKDAIRVLRNIHAWKVRIINNEE